MEFLISIGQGFGIRFCDVSQNRAPFVSLKANWFIIKIRA